MKPRRIDAWGLDRTTSCRRCAAWAWRESGLPHWSFPRSRPLGLRRCKNALRHLEKTP